MKKHTQGEWKAKRDKSLTRPLTEIWSSVDKYEKIFEIRHNEEILSETEANAKLIAAAPKLLEALEKIIEMNYQTAQDQYGDRRKADDWSCVVVAKEAIKQATE